LPGRAEPADLPQFTHKDRCRGRADTRDALQQGRLLLEAGRLIDVLSDQLLRVPDLLGERREYRLQRLPDRLCCPLEPVLFHLLHLLERLQTMHQSRKHGNLPRRWRPGRRLMCAAEAGDAGRVGFVGLGPRQLAPGEGTNGSGVDNADEEALLVKIAGQSLTIPGGSLQAGVQIRGAVRSCWPSHASRQANPCSVLENALCLGLPSALTSVPSKVDLEMSMPRYA
jgi:hypothetical protein